MKFAPLLLLLLLGETRTSTLVDDVYRVGAGRTRYLDIAMPVEPVRVLCAFEVEAPAEATIRAQLVDAAGEVVADTGLKSHGGFSTRPARLGKYRLLLNNRSNPGAVVQVALHVRLVYGEGPMKPVRHANPTKGKILVWSSMAVFATIALFAGAKIKSNLDRKW